MLRAPKFLFFKLHFTAIHSLEVTYICHFWVMGIPCPGGHSTALPYSATSCWERECLYRGNRPAPQIWGLWLPPLWQVVKHLPAHRWVKPSAKTHAPLAARFVSKVGCWPGPGFSNSASPRGRHAFVSSFQLSGEDVWPVKDLCNKSQR